MKRSNSNNRSILNLLILGCISIFVFESCDELEPVNPADPSYTLKAPTLVSVQTVSDVQMSISWQNNEEYSKEFVISRKSGSGSFSGIGTVNKDQFAFTDTACELGTEYSYTVQSKVSSNISVNSNSLKGTSTFPAPSNLTVNPISDESVRLTWTDNTGFETGFKLERDEGFGFVEVGMVSGDVTQYTASGLTSGQSYDYRVAAYTSVNTSLWVTNTGTTDFPAPSDISATSVSDNEIQLNWTDNTNYEIGFKIERGDGIEFIEIGTTAHDVTEYIDNGLTFNQEYKYRVAAYTSINTSSWVIITATTEFLAPSALTASSLSDREIELTWTDNTGYEAGFKIERDHSGGFVEIGTVVADANVFIDSGLILGHSFDYRVAAITAHNTSGYSNTVSQATEFPGPSDLAANGVSDSELQLTWTVDTSNETGFKIERDAGGGFVEIGIVEIGTIIVDVIKYNDTGLILGQSYDYRVAAITAYNTSDYSNTVSHATEFPAPSDLSASSVSDSEIQLSWTDNTSFEEGFLIERDSGDGFNEIGSVSANVTEYIDNEVAFGQINEYRVAAYTANNLSEYCIVVSSAFQLEDYDGNIYGIVQIGGQVWMAENLKVTHYRDGTAIPNVTDGTAWANATDGAYCYQSNSTNLGDTYGALYNWHAVGDSHILAPAGWHIPTANEWQTLFDYVGGTEVAGGKLKEAGTVHWNSPNTDATNEYLFTALPSGERAWGGGFDRLGEVIFLWSSSSNGQYGTGVAMSNTTAGAGQNDWWKENGYSVRCIKD